MAALSRDDILAANDLPLVEVQVPEWNGSVFVRALNGKERLEYSRGLSDSTFTSARFVALCVVDDKGARLFDDADVEALEGKHGNALERIVRAALKLNYISDEGISEAKNG